MKTPGPILINQGFANQRITGQQRYAVEISARLSGSKSFVRVTPGRFFSTSMLRTWAWVLLVLPAMARRATVLSMTARAPAWNRRHVLVVHDLFVLTNPEWFSRRYVWTHAPLLRTQIRRAAAVVAVSQPVADQLAAMRHDPVPVAPNAPSKVFSLPDPSPEENRVLAERGLEAGSYFLTVGSRDPRKNLARLVAAYGRLDMDVRRKHPLVVVGAGNSIFRDRAIAWPEGTVDAGYVCDHDLRRLYRGALSMVFVSEAEGFGLPLVEAAAAGTPSMLVSDIDVFRWICGDQARYVDPRSTASIAEGLRAEIDQPWTRKIDLAHFGWDASAAVVAAVCRRVAGEG